MIRVPLPLEDALAAEAMASECNRSSIQIPPRFNRALAWELANLTRIAYGDYFRYSNSIDLAHLINVGDTLWLPSNSTSDLIDHFWLKHCGDDSVDPGVGDSGPAGDSLAYNVLAVFTYLAFEVKAGLGLPRPEVDRFGFILERILPDGSKEVNIIFRGTIEPSEWFNDFQYKQIPFLQTDNDHHLGSMGEVSLGFNKIYTDYRPGLAMGRQGLNKLSREIDETIRERALRQHPEISSEHKMSMMKTVQQALDPLLDHSSQSISINVAGHSLGAALATICALHASILGDLHETQLPVSLYTFASPRVGNPQFAKTCNVRLNAIRIANSEDVVPGIPPATLKIIGQEMSPGKHVEAVREVLAFFTGGVTDDVFEHVGSPVYFTTQLGEISSNHNMGHTYCAALRESPSSSQER